MKSKSLGTRALLAVTAFFLLTGFSETGNATYGYPSSTVYLRAGLAPTTPSSPLSSTTAGGDRRLP